MAASYPSSAKAFTPVVDGVDYPQATQIDQAYDEITALEQALVSTGLAHNLFADVTATRDLGTSAVKWRDLFLSRNGLIGGTLGVTGVATFTAQSVHSAGVDISGASAGQVVFPAAQNASAGVNTLDDYEEGTWTPTITGSGGGSGQVYNTQAGRYVKVGKMVTVWGDVVLSTLGTVTTAARIGSLPFTPASVLNMPIAIGYFSNLTTSVIWLGGHVLAGTAAIDLYKLTVAAVTPTTVVQGDLSNTSRIMFSAAYEASA